MWNPTSGKQVADPLPVTAGPVSSIAFAPGGGRFATTGGRDGAVKLWSESTLQQEGTTLNTVQRRVLASAFVPNGNDLVVVNDHGDGFAWPTAIGLWKQRACSVAGRNLTRAEWAHYVTGHPYRRVCP